MKILIVEDERQLSDSVVAFLVREDYLCEQAFTYDEAITREEAYDYDYILLDLMLPGGNAICDYHHWSVAYSFEPPYHQFIVNFN